MSDADPKSETYSEEETVACREAALKRMLATPNEKHKQLGARKLMKHKSVEKPE